MFISPRELGIDKDGWRPSQWQAIADAVGTGKKIVLSEIPTGTGKSITAVAISRMLGAEKTFYMTGTKQLQDQYMSLNGLVTMKGRSNYECFIDPVVQADEGQCTFGKSCNYRGLDGQEGCAYYGAKREAVVANDLVLNYAYGLRQISADGLGVPKVLVCDEAHGLRGQLENYVSVELRTSHLDLLDLPWPTNKIRIGVPPEVSFERLKEWATEITPALDVVKKRYDAEHFASHLAGGMTKEERRFRVTIKNLRETLSAIRSGDGGDNWIVIPQTRGWELKPVWVKGMFNRFMNGVDRTVFMSATILDPRTFLEVLGIASEDVAFFRYPSPFAKERRPLFYDDRVKVSGTGNGNYAALVERMDEVIDRYPDTKGLIHTVSYDLQKAVFERSRHKRRMMSHGTGDRDEKLLEFIESENRIMVSPSFGTGVDLPGELLRWQIILKLPYPSLGDLQRKEQMKEKLGKELYTYDTVCNLVQMYGRAMRSEEDFGDTWLLDGGWDYREDGKRKGLRMRVEKLLPEWFREAIQSV